MSFQEFWLTGGTALVMDAADTTIENSAIHVKDGKIAWIGAEKEARIATGARKVDTSKCIVTPGFINGHTHTGMTLLRGLANDLPLDRWLNEAVFPMEQKWAGPEFVHDGNLLAAAEMIRAGITSFADMYYFQESAAKAMHQAGLRMLAGAAIIQISKIQDPRKILDGLDHFRENLKQYPLVQACMAPHSIYGVDDSLWGPLLEYSAKYSLLLHIHIAESQAEEATAFAKYGKTTVQYLESVGLWKQKVLAAHCVELTPEDIQIMGSHRAGVAYNPESNLKLGNRICPVVELRRAGAKVCLGTDSVVSNNNLQIIQEADVGLKLQSMKYGPGAMTARDMVRVLTQEGADALQMGDRVGSLEVGKRADIIAVDTWKAHMQPVYDPYAHVVYSATSRDVKHSIVDGKILMEDFALKTLDEKAILEMAFEWGAKVRSSR
jgi:5-methylthioadenosine/S-adenosylhomocysteine deaminase